MMARAALTKEQMTVLNAKMPMRLTDKGDIMTSPVYLDYVQGLLAPRASDFVNEDGSKAEPKFGCTVLFQHGQDMSVIQKVMTEIYTEKGCKRAVVQGKPTGPWMGQHSPILKHEDIGRDKETGEMKTGYTEGAFAVRVSTKSKPVVVHGKNQTPVVPPAYDILYSGVLAICVLNAYYYPTDKKKLGDAKIKKGVGFGIKHVILINTNTPKFFEGGNRPASLEDLKELNIDSSLIVDFETEDGGDAFADDAAFGSETVEELAF